MGTNLAGKACPHPGTCELGIIQADRAHICALCQNAAPEEQCFKLAFANGDIELVDVSALVSIDVSESVKAITTYLYKGTNGYTRKMCFDSMADI